MVLALLYLVIRDNVSIHFWNTKIEFNVDWRWYHCKTVGDLVVSLTITVPITSSSKGPGIPSSRIKGFHQQGQGLHPAGSGAPLRYSQAHVSTQWIGQGMPTCRFTPGQDNARSGQVCHNRVQALDWSALTYHWWGIGPTEELFLGHEPLKMWLDRSSHCVPPGTGQWRAAVKLLWLTHIERMGPFSGSQIVLYQTDWTVRYTCYQSTIYNSVFLLEMIKMKFGLIRRN